MLQRQQEQQQQQQPGQEQPTSTGNTPATGGMGAPNPKNGERQLAAVHVRIALKMMERALPVLGSNSQEGKALLEAMTKLSKMFGQSETKSLVPAEILQMQRAEPSLQGSAPQQPQQPQQAPQQPQQPPPQIGG